jgi:predicted nucleic acid-binding protein
VKIVVDTTVLVYAVGTEHELREPCRQLLVAHGRGVIEAATTVEVIQEFVHVRARRRDRHDATTLGRQYVDALQLIVQEPHDLELGLTLFEQHPKLGAFDAVLAAVVLNRGIDALISADRAFSEIPGLPFIHPTSPEFGRILSQPRGRPS